MIWGNMGTWGKRSGTLDVLKKDNPTRSEVKRAADHYFKHQSGIILPKDYSVRCGGCGSELYNKPTEIYFGEKFCRDCVDKWKAGEQ